MWLGSDMVQQFLRTIAILILCIHAWLGYHNLYGDAILVASWATYSNVLWSWRLDCLPILFRHVARMVASLFRRQDPSIVSNGFAVARIELGKPIDLQLAFCLTLIALCFEIACSLLNMEPSLFWATVYGSWAIIVLEPWLFLNHPGSWAIIVLEPFLNRPWLFLNLQVLEPCLIEVLFLSQYLKYQGPGWCSRYIYIYIYMCIYIYKYIYIYIYLYI